MNYLDSDYKEHKVFAELNDIEEFYDLFSMSIMTWVPLGTQSIINFDTYVYSSMHGTIESIKNTLEKGRINDSYALLRKFYDAIVVNIYTNLYLETEFDVYKNFRVDKINNWLVNKEKMPSFREMSKYIESSDKVKKLTKLFFNNTSFKGSEFEKIRERCNNNVHYLHYRNMMINNNRVNLKDRLRWLDTFKHDIVTLVVFHLSHIFYFKNNYMMSCDYQDSMDLGITPEKDSEYFVAPFIQEFFDEKIMKYNPEIGKFIKENTKMHLD